MNATRIMTTLALVLPLAVGCKKRDQPTPDPGSGAAVAGSGSDVASGSGSAAAADALMTKKGGNCPSLVATATTTVTLDDATPAATVTIVATDPNAIVTVQARAKAFKDRHKDGGQRGSHDGKGGKVGDDGLCPIAAKYFEVTAVKDTADGVAITLALGAEGAKLDTAARATALAEVNNRADKAAAWMNDNLKIEPGGQGGTGPGSGQHGRDHSGKGDAKGTEGSGAGGGGSGAGTGGGSGAGTGGGSGAGKADSK